MLFRSVTGANVTVASVDPTPSHDANVALIPADTISVATTTTIGNAAYSFFNVHPASNANTSLANAFTFTSLTTYPISSVQVNSGSSGITVVPQIHAESIINTSVGTGFLGSLGILAPIQITSGGQYYKANDVIQIVGGTGVGANAKVTGVGANGAIANVAYVSTGNYPAGGLGYSLNYLPTTNVVSSNATASGAVLTVPGILGAGATFAAVTDRAGAIATIDIVDPGQDYVAKIGRAHV